MWSRWFRERFPEMDVALPPLSIEKLPSGLTLLAVHKRGLPLFHARLSSPAGKESRAWNSGSPRLWTASSVSPEGSFSIESGGRATSISGNLSRNQRDHIAPVLREGLAGDALQVGSRQCRVPVRQVEQRAPA